MLHIDDKATRRFARLAHCAGGVLTLAVAAVMYVVLYAPTMKAVDGTHRQIQRLQQLLQEAPGIQREHAELTEQLEQREAHLAEIRRRVPQQAGESEFLSELAAAAEDVGVVITNLTPAVPQQTAAYTRLEVTLTGQASYESLCRFVDRLRGFPRLVEVHGLDVRTAATGQDTYPVTVTVAIFFDLVVPEEVAG